MGKSKSRAGGQGDHRTRVGRQRATRTEARILAVALGIFAEKGPDAPVVDDFVKAAGIARGTFYNYFGSVEQLLEATSVWTSGTTVAAITDAMAGIGDPAHRVGTGFRLFLGRARAEPVWALFIARVWKLGDLRPLSIDLARGRAAGSFRYASVGAAMDVLLGGAREALFRLGEARAPDEYVEQVVAQLLQGLGLPAVRVAAVLRLPLPAVSAPSAPPRRLRAPRAGRVEAVGQRGARVREPSPAAAAPPGPAPGRPPGSRGSPRPS